MGPISSVEINNVASANQPAYRSYSGTHAAAYAYNYTTSATTDQTASKKFYNSLFPSLAGSGGDCMNFASQCMWAGFYGSNDATSLATPSFPMDTSGSQKWYISKNGGNSSSWTYCPAFRREYIASGQSENAAKISATQTYISASTNSLSSVPGLVGAIGLVDDPSVSGPDDHAIIITDAPVSGATRSNTYYCAHTRDVKKQLLSDTYGNGTWAIYFITPRNAYKNPDPHTDHTYTLITTGGVDSVCNYSGCSYCRMKITPQVHPTSDSTGVACRPVKLGNSISIKASCSVTPYSFSASVTTPSGATVQMGTVNNTANYQKTYTPSEIGLYSVTFTVKDHNQSGSKTIKNTITFRIYN